MGMASWLKTKLAKRINGAAGEQGAEPAVDMPQNAEKPADMASGADSASARAKLPARALRLLSGIGAKMPTRKGGRGGRGGGKTGAIQLDAKRLGMIAAVVVAFGSIGVFAAIAMTGGVKPPDAEAPGQIGYMPSKLPYKYGDGMKKAALGESPASSGSAGLTGGAAGAAGNAGVAGAADSGLTGGAADAADAAKHAKTSIVDVLHPNRHGGSNGAAGVSVNYIDIMRKRLAEKEKDNPGNSMGSASNAGDGLSGAAGGQAPESTGSADSADLTDSAGAASPAGSAGSAGMAGSAGSAGTAVADAAAEDYEPNILMRTDKPFDISISNVSYNQDVLVSGRMDVRNNTIAEADGIYIKLYFEYNYSGAKFTQSQYAYTAAAGLEPGAGKSVSFAAIPPVKGNSDYRLAGAEIEAFTTTIGGFRHTVYVDSENSLLQLLGDADI
jgi:hypothetical protein